MKKPFFVVLFAAVIGTSCLTRHKKTGPETAAPAETSAGTSLRDDFFKDQQTGWAIHLPAEAGAVETYAAEELQAALKKVSGADFRIVKGGGVPAKNSVVLGSLASSPEVAAKAGALKLKAGDAEQLAVYTLDGNLYLAGNNPRGCLYAVYSFLQRELGVRWLWPGDDGEFMPVMRRFALPKLAWNYRPPFRFREMTPCDWHYHAPTEIWMARNFLNMGSRTESVRDKAGFYRADGGHSVTIRDAGNVFKSHPEYFSLLNGARRPEGLAGCWSNPDFERMIVREQAEVVRKRRTEILNIFPADITQRCECEACAKNPDASSRWFEFYHKIILGLKKEFPELKFGGIAYQEYRAVPASDVQGLEFVEYCQYNRCYVHKLADTNCQLNAKSMAELKAWQTKVPMAIYGYEFDVFSPAMHVPFWNMLADEIKTFRAMNLVRLKTEMSVNWSKDRPREELVGMKWRLPYYLYARLVWEPDSDVNALLADWCRTAYGPGAAAMLAYHQSLASAWDAMPRHLSYFGTQPTGTAKHFLSDDLIQQSEGNFRKAEAAVSGTAEPAQRSRAQRELALDQALFQQWKKLYQLSRAQASADTLCLPLLAGDQAFAQAAKMPMRSKQGKHKPTDASIYWTADGLHLRVTCHDPQIAELKRGIAGRDVNLWNDDTLEIFLDCADGKAYRHLALNPAGGRYDAAGNDRSWNPEWDLRTAVGGDRWSADIRLPFAALGKVPRPGDQWVLILNRNGKPEACGFPIPAYHDLSSGGILYFSDKALPKRRLSWLIRDDDTLDWYAAALLQNGWNYRVLPDKRALTEGLDDSGLIVINTYKATLPEAFYTERLRPAVQKGAVVLFNNYGGGLRLEKYFQDETFRVKFSENLDPLRKTITVTTSAFASVPDNLANVLGHTPPGVHIPAVPEKWEFLATQKMKDGTEQPYLMARPYGKGLVAVSAPVNYAKSPQAVVSLLNNLLEYNAAIKR